jgi:Xaa-Pro aminopeptidase
MRAGARRAGWVFLLASLCLAALHAVEPEPRDVFEQRRREIARQRPDGAIVLFGVDERQGRMSPGPFLQESNFYYLSGCREPDAALLIEPASGGRPYRETLFLTKSSTAAQEWNGRRIDPADPAAAGETGFGAVLGASRMAGRVRAAAGRYERVYTIFGEGPEVSGRPAAPDAEARLAKLGVEQAPHNLRPALAAMRLIKSAGEVRRIEQAVAASVKAHRAAWRALRPGLAEYEVYAEMARAMILGGALRPAYPPIVAAGPNATTLHYTDLTSMIEPGDLVLIDVGGEVGGYAADLTRTVPASGRFSERQREVYQWVLEAQELAIAAARPGARLAGPGSLTEQIEKFFDSVEQGLSGRFRHAAGHFVGLDVHDPSPLGTTLAEGMVITIEPGLYLPEEGIGVRIEDMLLITEDGARLLSAELPREPGEIERALAER